MFQIDQRPKKLFFMSKVLAQCEDNVFLDLAGFTYTILFLNTFCAAAVTVDVLWERLERGREREEGEKQNKRYT